jgi:putative hydrolase
MGPAGWPFGPEFDLDELMRMLQSPGPVNWEVARKIAADTSTADPEADDDPEGGAAPAQLIDPSARDQIADIARAAQTHIAGATALSHALSLPIDVVDRPEWAHRTLGGLEPVVLTLAEAISPVGGLTSEEPVSPEADDTPFAALGPDIASALAPLALGWMAGSLAGLLAQFALGQYDLPLPLAGEPRLAFVASNIASFGHDWSLPETDLRFAIALREVVHGAQRSIPWVRERLVRLSSAYVGGYELRLDALAQQFDSFSGFDLSNPATLAEVELPDPGTLLDTMQTPAQQPILEDLQRFAAVLEGYADTVVDTVGEPLIPSLVQIEEALRRHRVDRGRAAAVVDRMLGLELGRDHYEQGHAFCRGVVERGGIAGLDRLWESEAMVPTPNELAAPGLWLARIEI